MTNTEADQTPTKKRENPAGNEDKSDVHSREEDTDIKAKKPRKSFYDKNVPASAHYHVSWMHAETITCMVHSKKHGYVISGSYDGIVKFWKRLEVNNDDALAEDKNAKPCLEFVKSFTAHSLSVTALAVDWEGDTCCSVGYDGLIKLYDISTFDATGMIRTPANSQRLGTSCIFFKASNYATEVLAVSSAESGDIYIYSPYSFELLQTVTIHGKSQVTCLAYNHIHDCVVSTDCRGTIELWDCRGITLVDGDDGDSGTVPFRVGQPVSKDNGVHYDSKMDTQLYDLIKKKVFAIAICIHPTGKYIGIYTSDQKVKVFDHEKGITVVSFDERSKVYDKVFSKSPFHLDEIEYGKRAATERDISSSSYIFSSGLPIINDLSNAPPLRVTIDFDPSGRYLLIPTMMGIKVIDWKHAKLACLIGKADASQLRFTSFCLCPGEAKVNRQMQLARKSSTRTSSAVEEAVNAGDDGALTKIRSDALLICTAYEQRRLYVFSHLDPVEDPESPEDILVRRDILNEKPRESDQVAVTASDLDSLHTTTKKAILRTTKGDIHLQLFAAQTPKTVENFVGHAKNGYYDNVIFHRVIRGFMLQTGDPLGDGTGGTSIWGYEFEDEFVPTLKHDRPFTLSMANAGPHTNGSQFFITTVPCPWLDNKHTVFGRVTRGMDVCTAIEKVDTNENDKPYEDIRILSIDVE